MLGLRLTEGLNFAQLTQEFGQDTGDRILEILQPAFRRQWAKLTPGTSPRLALTDPEGLLFSNTILAELFQHLGPDDPVE
jgi:coproporphyrinogen III oxidase-like Fe-S oxidoreductase